MKTEIKQIYKCEYCNKLYQRKHYCLAHEKKCSKSPINKRACLDCIFLHKKNVDYYEEFYSGEYKRILSLFHCEKLDLFLYPPSCNDKRNAFDLGDYSNEPMRKECNFQRSYYNSDSFEFHQ